MAMEPGEFLISESGYLLARVLVVKRYEANQARKQVCIIDGGMNLVQAFSLYGSYLYIYVNGKSRQGEELLPTDVYGNTNQSGDCLARDRLLPCLQDGDLLLVRNAGAYAYCRSTTFNERPRPATIWVDAGRDSVIKVAETVDALCQGEAYAPSVRKT